jgi:hypothetical protein
MNVSKADITLLGQSIEYKIAALDIKGTSKQLTQALNILRAEFERFMNKAA